MKLEDLPTSSKDDAMTLLCGNLIGSGVCRQVYSFLHDPNEYVVKVDIGYRDFQNVSEALIWNSVEYSDFKRWFAPISVISENGRFMIQRRTTVVTLDQLKEKLPKVPSFFTDLKSDNWGWLDGNIVCHDYGRNLAVECGINNRMKKASWDC